MREKESIKLSHLEELSQGVFHLSSDDSFKCPSIGTISAL